MGTGASTSVDLSLIDNLEDQFMRYTDEEIFGALEATVSDAKSSKQLLIQIGEIERLLGTISGSTTRQGQRARLTVRRRPSVVHSQLIFAPQVCLCEGN